MGFYTLKEKGLSFTLLLEFFNVDHSSVVFDDYPFDDTVYAMLICMAHNCTVHTPSELMPAGFILTHSHSCLSASRGSYIMNLIDSFCPP